MICCTSRDSRSLSVCIRPANRSTARVAGDASSTASASRLIAPTGVFSSWETFATKSRRIALDPPLTGAVLDERQDQPRSLPAARPGR